MTLLDRIFSGDPAVLTGLAAAFGDFSINLLVALVILAGTFWASGWASDLVGRAIGRMHRQRGPDKTLQSFFSSLARYVVIIVGLIAVLQQVGVRTTSIIAVLGAASLAVGLALQGALSNVAAGVMLLLFRPYRVGDEIEIGGRKGVVKSLDLFVTELATSDNVRIMAPNGKVFGDFILNYSHYRTRRAEVVFRIDLEDDVGAAVAALVSVAEGEEKVLDIPAPNAEAVAVGDSWIEVAVKAWAKREDHSAVKSALLIKGVKALRQEGFAAAYPRQVAVEPATAA